MVRAGMCAYLMVLADKCGERYFMERIAIFESIIQSILFVQEMMAQNVCVSKLM